MNPTALSIVTDLRIRQLNGQRGYAAVIAKQIDKSHTSVNQHLRRLEAQGYVNSQMEPLGKALDRAPRRYYELSPQGVGAMLRAAAAKEAEAQNLLGLVGDYRARQPRMCGLNA